MDSSDFYETVARRLKAAAPTDLAHATASDPAGIDIYFDESGHTGLNFLDPQPPVFVEAGWIVPRPLAERAERLVSATSTAVGRPKELKGGRLMGSPQGRNAAAGLLEGFLKTWPATNVCNFRKAVRDCGQDHRDIPRSNYESAYPTAFHG
jgi:hypothetical protein